MSHKTIRYLLMIVMIAASFIKVSAVNKQDLQKDVQDLLKFMGVGLNPNASASTLDDAGNKAVTALNDLGFNTAAIKLSTCSQQEFNIFIIKLLSGFVGGVMASVNSSTAATVIRELNDNIRSSQRGHGTTTSLNWNHSGVSVTDPVVLAASIADLSAAVGSLIEQIGSPALEDSVIKGLGSLNKLYSSEPVFGVRSLTKEIIDNLSGEAYKQLGSFFITGIVGAAVVLQQQKINKAHLQQSIEQSHVGAAIAQNVNRVNSRVTPKGFDQALSYFFEHDVANFFTHDVSGFFTDTIGHSSTVEAVKDWTVGAANTVKDTAVKVGNTIKDTAVTAGNAIGNFFSKF